MCTDSYPQRIELEPEEIPADHWCAERGWSSATGWEMRMSADPADWWYEYVDEKSGDVFYAR